MARPKKRKETRGKRGQGSVFQRKDGLWVASLTVNGARITRYAQSEDSADRILLDLRRDAANGALLTQSNQTVADYLTMWLTTVVEPQRRHGTYRQYESLVRVYLIPHLGRIKLTALTPAHVQKMIVDMARAGASANTQAEARLKLAIALNRAVKWELVARNVASLTDVPRRERAKRPRLSGEQLQTFFDVAEGMKFGVLQTLAAVTGLRLGEVMGLSWDRVDLEHGTLTVDRQLLYVPHQGLFLQPVKTDTSNRAVPLPPFVLPILKRHRARQNEERLAAGSWWQDQEGMVFTKELGTLPNPRSVAACLKHILKAAGLPPETTMHSLRRSYASLLAKLGAKPVAVQALLGHASPEITFGIYAAADDEAKREAVDLLDRYFAR